jgi:3-oxoacyl-[acyl-carrier-protein] synthase I
LQTTTKRIAVTGLAINTPIGDTLPEFLQNLLSGRSAITRWRSIESSNIYSKIGADLGDYDIQAKVDSLEESLPGETHARLRQLVKRAPWSVKLTLLLAADAWLNARLIEHDYDDDRIAVLIAGHNVNQGYTFRNFDQFNEDPEFVDGLFALHGLDTDHAGCVSEMLQVRGPIYTIGAACASGNLALRSAVDEIRHRDCDVALVLGAVLDFSPLDLQGMAIMGALACQSFNDEPHRASRPFDQAREGFVPAHGGAALILEDYDRARGRGARIHAEVLGVAAGSDGCHLPQPSQQGQVATMRRVLANTGVPPERVDFISAHATSTPLGDLTEIASIKEVFGKHTDRLAINAPKSILGHACWSAATVETVAAILQMNAGRLHPSINVDDIDPAIDVDVCANEGKDLAIEYCMKNAFGFGGIDAVSLFRRIET